MSKRFLLITSLLLAVSFLAGCSDNQFVPGSYEIDGAEVATIDISVRDRRIDVSLSSDDQIHIDYFESSKEGYAIETSDGVLTMKGVSNKDWTDFIGTKPSEGNRRISLEVPQGILSSLNIKTTNEDITLQNISVSNGISLNSNGGNIRFNGLDAGKAISLVVKNGNINGDIIGSYNDFTIDSDVKKGESNLNFNSNGSKKLKVNANNGDVHIDFTK